MARKKLKDKLDLSAEEYLEKNLKVVNLLIDKIMKDLKSEKAIIYQAITVGSDLNRLLDRRDQIIAKLEKLKRERLKRQIDDMIKQIDKLIEEG